MLSIHNKNPNMVSKPIKLTLFIDGKSRKVLYAEAGKDFVDFILSLLILPVGCVVKLLQEASMAGSIGNLYKSIKNLSRKYIRSNIKNMLLKPTLPFCPNFPRLLQNDANGDSVKFYTCSNNHGCFTDFRGAPCRQCKGAMKTECIYVANDGASSSSVGGGGFVKDVVIYAVTDDLEVMPFKTEVLDDIKRKYGPKYFAKPPDKREVAVGAAEGLAILRATLMSKTVLTDTFLKKKALVTFSG